MAEENGTDERVTFDGDGKVVPYVDQNNEVKILTLDDIAQAGDVTEGPYFVKEWNGSVVIRSITQRTMRDIRKKCRSSEGDVDEDAVEKQVLFHGMVQPEINEGNYEMILERSYSAVSGITNAILGTSGQGDKAQVEAEKRFPQ